MNAFMNFFARTEQDYKDIGCGELEQLISEKGSGHVSLIDVRTEGEHVSGHIPDSLNINLMGPGFVARLDQMDRDIPYYVYCASGNRSRTACSQKTQNGFQRSVQCQDGYDGMGRSG